MAGLNYLSPRARDEVEVVLGQQFPDMRDVVFRVRQLSDAQVAHIARLFKRTDMATTYVAEEVRAAFDDILKGRVR